VKVRWVRGHNGDVYNERADALANEALRLAARR
jgi:ribonuclease HI